MNIGIITLSASDNCGSLLQSYALKKTLECYGNTEIINFQSEKSHIYYDLFPRELSIWKKIQKLRYINILIPEKLGYRRFRERILKIYGKKYFLPDLFEIADKYDVVVTGSDQVWNVLMGDFDDAFFLGWSNAKKIAYAPSLGGKNLKLSNHFQQIKEWLEQIDFISVRERAGKECLEEVTGKNIEMVLDPTLLIDEKDWKSLIKEPIVDGEYIFYYSWAYVDEETSKIVSDESRKSGLPVYVIDARKWQNKNLIKRGFTLCNECGPEAFLNLMFYAKKTYVESYHGMIFAYLFRKNFWLLDTHENFEELDTRLKELVELFGISNRVLTKYNVDSVNQNELIDYSDNIALRELRQKSFNFLNRALGENV